MSIWGNLEQANIRQERGTKENIQGCESGWKGLLKFTVKGMIKLKIKYETAGWVAKNRKVQKIFTIILIQQNDY